MTSDIESMSDTGLVLDYQLLSVPLEHGTGQLSLPGSITAHDLPKLRKMIEVVALEVNERDRGERREEADRVGAVKLLLEANGCDCDCDHDAESHDSDCERCLACRISWAIET